MSSAAIVAEIERESAAEVARLVEESDRRARAIVDEARADVDARVAAACERAEPGLRGEAARRTNAARLRLLERRAELATARTDAVFGAAARRLDAIAAGGDAERWDRALGRLGEEAVRFAGSGATLRVRSADAARLRGVAERLGAALRPDPAVPAGVVATAEDDRVEVDATLAARLARARVALAEPVAALVRLEG